MELVGFFDPQDAGNYSFTEIFHNLKEYDRHFIKLRLPDVTEFSKVNYCYNECQKCKSEFS